MKGETNIGQRKIVIILIMLSFMIFYIIRLFLLQVINTYIYTRQADEVSRREQIIPTRRGEIFDRNFDQPLVTNIDSFVIILDLSQVPGDKLQQLIARLAQMIDVEEQYLWNNISARKRQAVKTYEIWSAATYRQIAAALPSKLMSSLV